MMGLCFRPVLLVLMFAGGVTEEVVVKANSSKPSSVTFMPDTADTAGPETPTTEDDEMIDIDMKKVAQAWVDKWSHDFNDPKRDDFEWVDDLEYQWSYHEPQTCLDLVVAVLALEPNQKTMAVLSAGPLERVLANHGERVIDRVEALAQKDPAFAHLLGGVWQNSMSAAVWQRVQAVRDVSGWR